LAGGGLWGLDPHWKTDNPHCKRQGKKARGSGFDPADVRPSHSTELN